MRTEIIVDERHPVAARVRRHTRAQAVIMNPGRDEEVDGYAIW